MYMQSYDYLMHHGVLGQKWGVRRYQNPDGSLTPEGKARRDKKADKIIKDINDGGLNVNARAGYRMTIKDALSYGYIKKSANKDKKLKSALNDTFKSRSKKNVKKYEEEAIRFIDQLLGDRKDELVRSNLGKNSLAAREFIAYNFFNIKSKDIADIDARILEEE